MQSELLLEIAVNSENYAIIAFSCGIDCFPIAGEIHKNIFLLEMANYYLPNI